MNGTTNRFDRPMSLNLEANDVENSYPDVLPDRASTIIDEALKSASDYNKYWIHDGREISQVFVAGDMEGYPMVRSMLNERFNESRFTLIEEGLRSGFELGSAAAIGAALHASGRLGHHSDDFGIGCYFGPQLVEPIG